MNARALLEIPISASLTKFGKIISKVSSNLIRVIELHGSHLTISKNNYLHKYI